MLEKKCFTESKILRLKNYAFQNAFGGGLRH